MKIRTDDNKAYNDWLDKLPIPYDLDKIEQIDLRWEDNYRSYEYFKNLNNKNEK